MHLLTSEVAIVYHVIRSIRTIFLESFSTACRNLTLIGLVALFVLAATWIGSDRLLIRPLNALVDTTQRLSSGDLGARSGIPYKRGELGQLSCVFDEMAETLQIRQKEVMRTREELKHTNDYLSLTLKSLPIIVYTARAEGDYAATYISDNVEEVTGYKPGDFIVNPKFWAEHIHPDDAQRVFAELPELFEKGDYEHEYRWRIADGSYKWFYDKMRLIKSSDDKTGYIVGVWHDVTERKKAEECLRAAEERYRGLFDSTLDGVYQTNADNNFVLINMSGAQIFGYGFPEEIIGKSVVSHLAEPRDWDSFITDLKRLKSLSAYPIKAKKKDGDIIYLEATSHFLENEKGDFFGIEGILRDVTHHKKLEDQLRQAQKLEAVGQLAGGIAHDFNNILSAIIGYAHLTLMKMEENDLLRANIDQILDASQRAAVLTQSLLAFSRKQATNPVRTNLNDLIKRFEKFMLRLLREDIELKVICTDKTLSVIADNGQIEQVLMNLVTNARDAIHGRGHLTIETRLVEFDDDFVKIHGYGVPGNYALISVIDTGTGMDEKTKERIFEPFFTTKELGRGTGLGLSMVYGIIKQHNGYINVYSELGLGTTFNIYLPIAGTTVAEDEEKEAETAYVKGGTETILVAEDDAALRKLSSTVLRHYGYTIIEAVDGEDAISKFIENRDKIQLVILDGIMPKKNGKEAYEEIKLISPDIKTIFMSGYSEDVFKAKEVTDMGLLYLLKPVTPSILLKKVRETIDKHIK